MTMDIITVGVGGQGLMLLSHIIGAACADAKLDIKTAETHGLAQRSGSISTHVRIGAKIRSSLIPYGEAEVMVAMEALEALRHCEYIKEGGTIILNDFIWQPVQSTFIRVQSRGATPYLSFAEVKERLSTITPHIHVIDCLALARKAGNELATNTVLLGALARVTGFPLTLDQMKLSLRQVVPANAADANDRALQLGFNAM